METNRNALYFQCTLYALKSSHFLEKQSHNALFTDAQITVMSPLMYTKMHLIIIIQHYNKHYSETGNSA